MAIALELGDDRQLLFNMPSAFGNVPDRPSLILASTDRGGGGPRPCLTQKRGVERPELGGATRRRSGGERADTSAPRAAAPEYTPPSCRRGGASRCRRSAPLAHGSRRIARARGNRRRAPVPAADWPSTSPVANFVPSSPCFRSALMVRSPKRVYARLRRAIASRTMRAARLRRPRFETPRTMGQMRADALSPCGSSA